MVIARIPVVELSPDEPSYKTVRRYAKDWVRRRRPDLAVECTLQKLEKSNNPVYEDPDGVKHPLVALLKLTWWPRPPPLTELEELLEEQGQRKVR